MPDSIPPRLIICINFWTLWVQPSVENPWTLEERLREVKKAGFEAASCETDDPQLKELLKKYDLRFGGAFPAGSIANSRR